MIIIIITVIKIIVEVFSLLRISIKKKKKKVILLDGRDNWIKPAILSEAPYLSSSSKF